MTHTDVLDSTKPKAQLRATGEIIRKDGTREPIVILGDPAMTQEELVQQLRDERENGIEFE